MKFISIFSVVVIFVKKRKKKVKKKVVTLCDLANFSSWWKKRQKKIKRVFLIISTTIRSKEWGREGNTTTTGTTGTTTSTTKSLQERLLRNQICLYSSFMCFTSLHNIKPRKLRRLINYYHFRRLHRFFFRRCFLLLDGQKPIWQ